MKICTACKSVKYCGVKCQKEHRPKHKHDCKKRAAELNDELLFRQPASNHLGECPICCLPLPIDTRKSALSFCCCKIICNGCDVANQQREANEGRDDPRCPFCRELYTNDAVKWNKRIEDHAVKRRDPVAMLYVGIRRRQEEGDYQSALKLL